MADRVYPGAGGQVGIGSRFFCQCSEPTKEVTDEDSQVRRGAVEVLYSIFLSDFFGLSGILCVLQFCFLREGEEVRWEMAQVDFDPVAF
jgi:hypothetical protein